MHLAAQHSTFTPVGLQRRNLLELSLGAGLFAGLGTRHAAAAGATISVRLPRHISHADPQFPYVRQLVELALHRAGLAPLITEASTEMTQTRSMAELAQGGAPHDVMWTVTDRHREATGVLPIRVPIDRGLLGWRVLLVRRDQLPRWADVKSVSALRERRAGQGHDWPDTEVLRANGLPVATSSNYEALFRMLESRRFDYFPRSVLEVDAELASPGRDALSVVPDLLLFYPAATYLFVTPSRADLAYALLRGLKLAIADGSFQRLHLHHYGTLWRRYAPPHATVIRLNNPTLSPETPVDHRELWLDPKH